MMDISTKATKAHKKIALYAAGIALSAFVIALLAVAFATGPAQAQNADNNYPAPRPCGPGPNTDVASQPEPHEVTEGHFALFEAYWRTTEPINTATGTINTGALHANLCPPKMVTTKETDPLTSSVTETTKRTTSNIAIKEAIMHVQNEEYQVDVVGTNAEATSGQLSLEEYPDVRKALRLGPDDPVPPETKVWWLKLDDPDTTGADEDETSDLSLGFSTLLLDGKYWLTRANADNEKPMRYKFEVQRYPTDPADDPHFFAYEAPNAGGAAAKLVWDSFRPDDEKTDMLLDPGEYRALQWVFTKPGTYLLSVHLQGFVRKENPHLPDHPNYDANWEPISNKVSETSDVKQYTIQVGDKLDETEPPIFGVSLSVAENTQAGASVGDPIPVYNADADVLYYDLVGVGEEDFDTVAGPGTDPHTVQIVVADGASLDYETRSSYDLSLTVTDKLDHEGNPQDENKGEVEIDDILIVRIALEDQAPGLILRVDQAYPAVRETVNFTAWYEPTPELADQAVEYVLTEREQTKHDGIKWHLISPAGNAPTWSVDQSSAVSKVYRAAAQWDDDDDPGTPPKFVHSEEIRVTWGDPVN